MRPLMAASALAFSILTATLAPGGTVVDEIVVKVNDSVVTKTEFDRRVKSTTEGMRKEYKGPDLEGRVKEIPQLLLEQMVEELLLIEKAKQMYQVDEIVKFQIETFMKENGIASLQDLEKALASEGLTMEEFKKQMLQVFVPEFVKSREVRPKVTLSEEEIQAYYEAHKGELATQPQLNLQEIFLPRPGTSEEEARRIAAEVARQTKEGKDFGELAANYSQAFSKTNRGDAGWYSAGDLSPELSKPVFATPVGATTDLLATGNGYYIFRIAGRKEPKVPTLDESREAITDRLRNEKFQKAYKEYIDLLKQENYLKINPKYV